MKDDAILTHARAVVDSLKAETREASSRIFLNHAKGAAALLLGAAALLYAAGARAEVVGEIANEAGGTISLTDDWGSASGPCGEDERLAFGTSSAGHVVLGCWVLVDKRFVGVTWLVPGGRRHKLYAVSLVRIPPSRGLQL